MLLLQAVRIVLMPCSRPLRVVHSTLVTRVLLNLRTSAAMTSGYTGYGDQTRFTTTLGWELAVPEIDQGDISLRDAGEDCGPIV